MADAKTEDLLVARFLLVRHGESKVMVDGVVGGPKTCGFGNGLVGVREGGVIDH